MTADIRRVDFCKKRHTRRAKALIEDTCIAIQSLDYEVAGYATVVWDDSGRSSVCYMTGGPFSSGGLPEVVSRKIDKAIIKNEI